MAKFGAAKANRVASIGVNVGAVLSLMAFFANSSAAAYKTATFNPDTDVPYQAFMEEYKQAIDTVQRTNSLKTGDAQDLKSTFITWLRSMDYDSTVVNALDKEMYRYIETSGDFTPSN